MDLTEITGHRPWPLPPGPWVMAQHWGDVLFAHWQIDPDVLRPHVPQALALDLFHGRAYLGATPFCVSGMRPRALPPVPLLSTFPEVDLRTYVTLDGKPAVFYLTMRAPNPMVTAAARLVYHLPYTPSEVEMRAEGDGIRHCCREKKDSPEAEWDVVYRPVSDPFQAREGTLEYFLVERWAMYTVSADGKTEITEIHRLSWPVQTAEAEIRRNTLPQACGISLPAEAPLLHYSSGVDVLLWAPSLVEG